MHMLPGRVSSVDESHDGKHATVTITHGKRKRSKDDKGKAVGGTGGLYGYDRPTSRLTMSKKHAASYPLGTKVAGMGDTDPEDEMDDDGDEDGENNSAPAAPAKRAPSDRPILKALARKKARGK